MSGNIESLILYFLAGVFGFLLFQYSKKKHHGPIFLVGVHAVLFIAAHGVLTAYIANKSWEFSSFEEPGYIIESVAFTALSIAAAIGGIMFFIGKVLSRHVPNWARISYTVFGSLGFLILLTATFVNFSY